MSDDLKAELERRIKALEREFCNDLGPRLYAEMCAYADWHDATQPPHMLPATWPDGQPPKIDRSSASWWSPQSDE